MLMFLGHPLANVAHVPALHEFFENFLGGRNGCLVSCKGEELNLQIVLRDLYCDPIRSGNVCCMCNGGSIDFYRRVPLFGFRVVPRPFICSWKRYRSRVVLSTSIPTWRGWLRDL